MAATVVSNFDALSTGTVPTAANTGFDSVFIAGTVVGDTALKYQGTASIDGSGAAYFTRLLSSRVKIYDAFYFYPETSPSAAIIIVEARSTSSTGAVAYQVQMMTGRTLRIRNSSQTAVATGTVALPIGQWSRVEVGVNNGAAEVRIYAGTSAVESSTPSETLTASYTQTDIDWLSIGQISTATFDWHLDYVRTDPDTWVGPLVAAPSAVVAAGPDQSGIEPGATVALTSAGSTTTGLSWTQTSGPAAALSSASSASPTFIAPPTLAGVTLVYRATDTATGIFDEVAIGILAASRRVKIGGVMVPTYRRAAPPSPPPTAIYPNDATYPSDTLYPIGD